MFEFGSLIRYATLRFVLKGFRLGFIPDKPGPADLGHSGAGQGHGRDREASRSRLVPLSAIGDHRRWQNDLKQCRPVLIELQIDSSRFLCDFFQLIGCLRSYGAYEDVRDFNLLFKSVLSMT